MTSTLSDVETRIEVLVLQVPDGIDRVRNLVTFFVSVSEIHDIAWKLTVGLETLISPPQNFSPAASPFPPTAPDLRIESIEQGSLIVRLMEDMSSGMGLGVDAAGTSGALWLLYRLLQKGPRTLAQFIAEVLSSRTLISTRRTQLLRDQAQAEGEEAAALKEAAEARIEQWLAQDNENRLWLRYQALINAAPDLQVKMLDQEGHELTEPSSSDG